MKTDKYGGICREGYGIEDKNQKQAVCCKDLQKVKVERYFEAYDKDIHAIDECIRLRETYTFNKFKEDFNSGKYIFGFISGHTSKAVITHNNGEVVGYGIGKGESGDAAPTARENAVRQTALGKRINLDGYEIVLENLGACRELNVIDFDFERSLMVKLLTNSSGREADYQALVKYLAKMAVDYQQESYIVAMKGKVVEFWGYETQDEAMPYSKDKLAGKEKKHYTPEIKEGLIKPKEDTEPSSRQGKTGAFHFPYKNKYRQSDSVSDAHELVGRVYGDRIVYFDKKGNTPLYWGYKTKKGVGFPYNQTAKGFVEPLRTFNCSYKERQENN